ncbi:MAG: hypothetical protein AABX31_01120 [Nanoarchaeota archaeon]
MTDKIDSLEDKVLEKLAAVHIWEWEYNGTKFTLQKDGWHVDIYGPKGIGGKAFRNNLNMIMLDDRESDGTVSDGDGYTFEGQKIGALYESLSEKHSQYSLEQAKAAKMKEDKQNNKETERILNAFLGK